MTRVASVWHSDTGRSRWYAVPEDNKSRAIGPFDTEAAALAAGNESGQAEPEPQPNEQAGDSYSLF